MQSLVTKPEVVLLDHDVSYDAVRKQAFHSTGKRLMRRIAKDLGLVRELYDLRSNLAGIAVSGEVTLHGDTLYLQLSQGVLGRGRAEILFRRCNGRKDYVGRENNFIEVARLADEATARRFVLSLRKMGELDLAPAGDNQIADRPSPDISACKRKFEIQPQAESIPSELLRKEIFRELSNGI